MSARQAPLAGAAVGAIYAIALTLRGDVAPGIVGGALLAVLVVLVIRRVDAHNAARRRRAGKRGDPPAR